MSEPLAQEQQYTVRVHEPGEAPGTLVFSFVPKDREQERGPEGLPRRVPQFLVAAREEAGRLAFDWSTSPDDPGAAREALQAEVVARMGDRARWIERVTALVEQVEQWARELGWSTRRVEKKLEDARVGTHRVPALLLQEDTCRALLEPVGRSTPGAEGAVDLYLMPAYDDIASLYYYGHRWSVHYTATGTNGAAPRTGAEARPLSKETLKTVLSEMRRHAA